MKNLIYLLLFFNFQHLLQGQEKSTVYLFFDLNNNKKCVIPKGDRCRYYGLKKIKKFEKNKQKKKVDFYICRELFVFDEKSKLDTIPAKTFKKIKFFDIWSLKKIVNNKNPLYPNIVFKKIYLVEPVNDSLFIKYDVIWQYYIE